MSNARSISDRPQKRLYSIKEASVYLGRSVWAVREMIWAGKLPYVKADRRIFLDIYDLDEVHHIEYTYFMTSTIFI